MDHPIIAIHDANVLYPAPIRDLFLRLAQSRLVFAHWTEMIHDEWVRNLLENNPSLSPENIARTRRLMNAAVRDCLVTGYEVLINTVQLPDPDDRHVLAAAIHADAHAIITYNLKDFPSELLSRHGIEPLHPDEFLSSLVAAVPGSVCSVVKRQRESLRRPSYTALELLEIFEGHGLNQSVHGLRPFLELL
jgi:predicted nucleic acid-binding protein